MNTSLAAFKKKFLKNILLAIFFVIYIFVFLFLFFTKGIFVNNEFYKKSANINSVTYTAVKNISPKKIILNKNIGSTATITIDADKILVDLNSPPDDFMGISSDSLMEIATQKGETFRGSENTTWIYVLVIYILFFILKRYNTYIYNFFNKNKAPGEGYYRFFDMAFTLFCITALIYVVISL